MMDESCEAEDRKWRSEAEGGLQAGGHGGAQTHRTAHQAPPCLWQEVTTGGWKHPHQLLQRFELENDKSLRLRAENTKEEKEGRKGRRGGGQEGRGVG